MASYHIRVKVLSRSTGRSGIAAAAYRARTKIHDERQGLTFDYSKKKDLVHSEIMRPDGAPDWMGNRTMLWNKVEAGERRKDAQILREVEVALPRELNREQRITLVREFVKDNYVSKGMVADINLHMDDGNPHAHILLTMRDVTEDGFGQKNRRWNQRSLIFQWRKNWADIQNQHLQRAGYDITVDHRSFIERGIELEPKFRIESSYYNKDRDLDNVQEIKRIMRENGEKIIADPYVALKALSHHKALFKDEDIQIFASTHSDDAQQFQKVCDAIYECDELVTLGVDADDLNKYTTQDLIDAEKAMLSTSKTLSEKSKHKVKDRYIEQAIATRTMNTDQEKAFRNIVQGGDAAAVIGYAGSGKSYTLGAVREAYEAQGYRLMGMALSGIAAEGLQQESGIESSTIHRQMYSWEKGYELPDKKTVIVVDEAGMVGTRQMQKITEYVKNAKAKLVLVGDYDQLQPIEAGGSFRGIVQEIGAATIGKIIRQNIEWHQEATRLLSGGREEVVEALDRYDAKGHIKLTEGLDDAKRQLIDAWKDKIIGAEQGAEKKSIILAYRNDDVRDLNQLAREVWRGEGRLSDEEVRVETAKGKRSFAEGDRILFRKNEYSMGVKNGSLGTIEAIEGDTFVVGLDRGGTVAFDPKDYKSFDHGYAATVHKSQGVTVDNTFVLATRHFDKHATYVALSRHRDDLKVFAGIDPESRRWDTFKDFGHLKMMLSRDGKKELIRDYGVHRAVEVDLSKVYKTGYYEVTVTSDKLKKPWTRTLVVSGKHNTREHRLELRTKAQEFAGQAAKVAGVDKRSMSIKVEKINDDRFVALNEKWKKEKQAKQDARTQNHFLSKTRMAQVKWPPFAKEEQARLLEKYSERYSQMIRFAGKREQVQGEYGGDFNHKGVRVGIIDTGREGHATYTLVPFAEELDAFKGKDVRYNLAARKVFGTLQKQMRMTVTDTVKDRSHTKTVTIEMGNVEDEVAQKKALARAGRRGFGPNSGQLKVSFAELTPEQKMQRQPEQAQEKRAFRILVEVPGTKRPFEKIKLVDRWERPEAIQKSVDRSARKYVSELAFKLRLKPEQVRRFKVDVAEVPFERHMEKTKSRDQGLQL